MAESAGKPAHAGDSKQRPTPLALAAIIGLGVVHALWALFQWTQLVAARTGGTSFCGLGESTACAEIWDSPFATAIQEASGMPVAGWGLVWSLASVALPVVALKRRAEPARAQNGPDPAWVATIWMAVAGVVAVVVLVTASISYGALCTTCALTYTLVAAYAATCFVQTPPQSLPLARGISPATIALAVSLAVLFIPGFNTPMSEAAEGRKALLKVAGEQNATFGRENPNASEEKRAPEPVAEASLAPQEPLSGLRQLLTELPPQLRQVFADELLRYASAEPVALREPRGLVGSPDAPIRLTEFTDALCSHCANLHETVGQLLTALPPGSFSVEARHFPLDAACNSALTGESTLPVRCLAARAEICMEGRADALDFAGLVYQNQRNLTEEQVYDLAARFRPRDDLAACVASDATQAKLQADIDWALEHGIEGTPLVLLNGRPVAPFGPLLYALILTGGDAAHPVFADLPEGVLRDPHEGHAH